MRNFALAALAGFLACALPLAVAAQDGKVIKDPAEYSAYMAALNTQAPAEKAAAMEAFVARYPASVVVPDALEQAMAAYQAAGDLVRLEATGRQVLAARPDQENVLAIVVGLERARATTAADAALAADAGASAEHGLAALTAWPKPDGVSDAQFAALRTQMTSIFNGAVGFAALQRKDYAGARGAYLLALAADPGDLQNAYQLAVADLQATPRDPAGFWWAARAWSLAASAKNTAAEASIEAYAKASYRQYHGADDGWDAIVAEAAQHSAPPEAFAISRAPTPAELAVKAVQQHDPATMSFDDWEFILARRDASPANQAAAARVWAAVLARQGDARLQLKVKVIAVTPGGFDVAITDDNQESNTPDAGITLAAPLGQPLAPGAMITVVGVLKSYTPAPFRFEMVNASVTAP
jgi:hypothetical protein